MKYHKCSRESGFTLVELLAVLIIVAILAAIGTPIYMQYVKNARATEAQTTISAIYTAEKVHIQKYGKWGNVDELVSRKMIDIDEATLLNWKFQVVPDGPEKVGFIVATSTGSGPVPAGQEVKFAAKTGKFSGYGTDDE